MLHLSICTPTNLNYFSLPLQLSTLHSNPSDLLLPPPSPRLQSPTAVIDFCTSTPFISDLLLFNSSLSHCIYQLCLAFRSALLLGFYVLPLHCVILLLLSQPPFFDLANLLQPFGALSPPLASTPPYSHCACQLCTPTSSGRVEANLTQNYNLTHDLQAASLSVSARERSGKVLGQEGGPALEHIGPDFSARVANHNSHRDEHNNSKSSSSNFREQSCFGQPR